MAANGGKGCKGAVSKAIGREITDAEFDKVSGEINSTLRMLWRTDGAKMAAMSKADQHRYAAVVAVENLKSAEALKVHRLSLSIARNAENLAYLQSRGMTFAAFNDITSFGSDANGSGRVSVESSAKAIAEQAKSEFVDLAEASGGKFFGMIEDGEQAKAFIRALFGEPTNNPAIARAVEGWKKATTALRERFNRAGGDIGNLGDLWHLPQSHDAHRISLAGFDKWHDHILPKLDRRQYVREDGRLMDDAEMSELLFEVFESIRTNGANKLEVTGRPKGKGARANRHAESRALFFKDGDSFFDYQLEFGGRNIYDTLFGHIDAMARDIALIETFGPHAEANARLLMDTIKQHLDTQRGASDGKNAAAAWRANAIFEEVAGIGQGPASVGWAQKMAAMRSLMVAARLGSAVLSSITDHATMIQTARMWNIPVMKMYRNYWKAMDPTNKTELRYLQRQGLAINVFAASMDRFSGDYGGMRTNKWANTVMRMSGLTAITDARRRAFSATMMSTIGDLVQSKSWDELDAQDLRMFKAKGVTPEIYAIWQKAKQESVADFPGGLLSGRSIMEIPDDVVPRADRERASTHLMAMILEEQNMAIIEPGARERAMLYAGTKRGTLGGEMMRAITQFKMFPFAMLTKHWNRVLTMPTKGGKIQHGAALFAMSAVTGALALEIKELVSGKDPRALWETDNPTRMTKTYVAAVMQGGALGIFGDFLTSTASRGGSDWMSTLAGPMAGVVGDVGNMAIGNAAKAAEGQETDVGADSLRIARGLIPGTSLWYAKAAFNSLVLANLQEMTSPGYTDRMRRRVERETGQQFWWKPGENLPDRAPNLSAVVR